jgi:SAM-dependent methyltransferase
MSCCDSPDEELRTDSVLPVEGLAYPGTELEAMAGASNYHEWILEIFKPFLGQHLLEVGAGLGSFSELILKHHSCQTLSLVEPSAAMYEQLVGNARRLQTIARVETYYGTLREVAALIKSRQTPDSIIYVNVLEHIRDDDGELDTIYEALSEAGRVLMFVPALPWLYGAFDERVGHVRRYTKFELERKLKRAGFRMLLSNYFDFAGIGPWWVKYCLLRSATMQPDGVRLYDRWVVPAAHRIEAFISPPIGKNIIAVAEKQ